MPHKFKSAYDFYKLPEHERRSYVGQQFLSTQDHKDCEFFVIGLLDNCFNYGIQQGVLLIFPPRAITYSRSEQFGKMWWKIGVFSPDDHDQSLEFLGDECSKFHQIRDFLRKWNPTFTNTSYTEVLELVRSEFGVGTHGD